MYINLDCSCVSKYVWVRTWYASVELHEKSIRSKGKEKWKRSAHTRTRRESVSERERQRKRARLIVNYVKLIKLYINVHLKLGDLEFHNGEHTGVRTYFDLHVCGGNVNEKYRWVPSNTKCTILLLLLSLLFQFGLSRLMAKTGKCWFFFRTN